MSTASFVPAIRGRDGDAVLEVLCRISIRELLKDAFLRFRHADGFSFARSMAFQVVLTLIPGLIFLVALATQLGGPQLQSVLREAVNTVAPGPAGGFLMTAFEQGADAGTGDTLAMILGGGAALISGISAMTQMRKGSNRIYGIMDDGAILSQYSRATTLALTVGLLLTASLILIPLGSSFVGALGEDLAGTWAWARWPLGMAALLLALAGLLRFTPNRDQPRFAWLALGGSISALGWLLVSIGLAVFLSVSTTFGETYGPLGGFIGLMLWALLSGIAVFYGIAVAAQLEAERAGVDEPGLDIPGRSRVEGRR